MDEGMDWLIIAAQNNDLNAWRKIISWVNPESSDHVLLDEHWNDVTDSQWARDLDGNGRTMLLVHQALCHRAGFSIAWERVDPSGYLSALTHEMDRPGMGILERHLEPFKVRHEKKKATKNGGILTSSRGVND